MAYNEHIYIQQMGVNASGNTYPCYDVVSQFGFYCKDLPFKAFSSVKEPFTQTWYDEDGDDEFIPDEMFSSAYDMTVEFAFKGDVGDANEAFTDFINYLRGIDYGGKPVFKMYSTYIGIGRKDIRLKSIDDDVLFVRNRSTNGYDLLVIRVTFKVNDPTTDITYNSTTGKLE